MEKHELKPYLYGKDFILLIALQNILSGSICVPAVQLLTVKSCKVLRILVVHQRLARSVISHIKTLVYQFSGVKLPTRRCPDRFKCSKHWPHQPLSTDSRGTLSSTGWSFNLHISCTLRASSEALLSTKLSICSRADLPSNSLNFMCSVHFEILSLYKYIVSML